MSWILPLPAARRMLDPRAVDRHRPGYWRAYHARNVAQRRPYLTKKAREYRAERRAA